MSGEYARSLKQMASYVFNVAFYLDMCLTYKDLR